LRLAFKPDTDDIRESRAIPVVRKILEEGAVVKAYDPKAMENFRRIFPHITCAGSAAEALKESDACLILTDWDEFRSLTDNDFNLMRNKVILEGRRVLDKEKVSCFEGICW
jgi:UDPglucose 6-dehydrogenase